MSDENGSGFFCGMPKDGWYLWKQLVRCETPYWAVGVCEVVESGGDGSWIVDGNSYSVFSGNSPDTAAGANVYWKRINPHFMFGIDDERDISAG